MTKGTEAIEEYDSPELCKRCVDPGACCQAFNIDRLFPFNMLKSEVAKHIANGTDPYDSNSMREKKPFFKPLRHSRWFTVKGSTVPESVFWLFCCSYLHREGMCTNYSKRPQVCRTFEPGKDLLCVMFNGDYGSNLEEYED